jgi:hypothetical protein
MVWLESHRRHGAGHRGIVVGQVVGGVRGVAVAVQLGGPGETTPSVMELPATVVSHLLAHL